jgi:anti-anti-sigma factor
MKIESNEETGIVAFIFEGRLDAVSSDDAEADMLKTIAEQGRYLYDLTSLEYISSAGLRALLATTKQIKRNEGRFVMCAPNDNVRHILDISGFASIFPLVKTREEGQRMLTE